MAMDKFGVYTDDSGAIVSADDVRKKKDDGVTGKAVKTAEEHLRRSQDRLEVLRRSAGNNRDQ
jgi:hypothetical protein